MATLAVVGLLVIGGGAAVMVATNSHYIRPPVDLSMADAEATYAACQRFARAELKAPGPVTFASIGRRTVRRYADGRLRVRAHADATNAAGRHVDVRVICTMRPLGGDRWDLESLSISTD